MNNKAKRTRQLFTGASQALHCTEASPTSILKKNCGAPTPMCVAFHRPCKKLYKQNPHLTDIVSSWSYRY